MWRVNLSLVEVAVEAANPVLQKDCRNNFCRENSVKQAVPKNTLES
jgi:hypothetical protein